MASLKSMVVSRIQEIGVKEASKLFGVSIGTVSNWAAGKTSPSIDALEAILPRDEKVDDELHDWAGKEVLILLPVYRSFNPFTHFTLFANYAKYGPDKLGLEMKTRTVIHESRNILIDAFMKNKSAKTALMFDDDMILPCGMPNRFNTKYKAKLPNNLASQVTISRLMSHGEDKGVVGGLYFGRGPNGHAQCASGFSKTNENAKLHELEYTGLKPEGWVATGCLKIEKWVIERLKGEIDNGRWPECKPIDESKWYGYFTPVKVGVGEDVSFGRRCAEIGIQSYVDTSLVCGHADGNYIYWPWNTKGDK